jgi:LmbE family N-acetylglucosaminyl deacetylase
MKTTPSPRSKHWQPEYESLLEAARSASPHGHLVDIRESLRYTVGPNRPLVILCPHADDGAITAACLLHEYAIRRGLPVIEVLVYAGERNVAAPWLNNQKKISVRESEFQLECKVLGAESVCWDLEGYRMPGYAPTPNDIDKVVEWFIKRRPGALIVPPNNDAHVAHRVTRALAAIGLMGANLSDTLVLTGWTPWGPLPQPNAYFSYDAEAERTKEWAIHCHASQVLLTDYTQYCSHLGRAYAALAREWAEGHSISGRAHRTDDRFVGVELYQIESFNPDRCQSAVQDPIHLALGYLSGYLKPERSGDDAGHETPSESSIAATTAMGPTSTKAASGT